MSRSFRILWTSTVNRGLLALTLSSGFMSLWMSTEYFVVFLAGLVVMAMELDRVTDRSAREILR